ncbi:MAG: hypothetical protein QOI62_724 [Solirubrobacteraceae bacterium]|jgi:hypothetical protein|nr:hypothetical protein [Solirubrobacteraceae bacterium]MEA2278227.1 hypothetical protein [Solirubrobacteraceae bacterium]MEA2357464.1 hypothetical protein [Solirubrobacteraceae bacterium]MEA2396064.1 hypothetical protein [Solirubrobacteraceae bacterium]
MPRRAITLLLAAVAALAVAGCGNKHSPITHGATEGVYLDVGPLKYQVQISRLLNPFDPEDRGYLIDLPGSQSLGPTDQWFAVFMRVENGTDRPQRDASDYQIKDSEGTVFRPVQMGPSNVFAYRAGVIPPRDTEPLPDSPAGQNSIQGALLLFKIPNANLENRPLELSIAPPSGSGPHGTVDLDI